MSSEVIAVWEPTSYWAPELQRELQPHGFRVLACRTQSELTVRLSEGVRHAVIVSRVDDRMPLPSLARWAATGARLHLVLSERDEPLRWFLAELGLTSVFNFDEARRDLVSTCRDIAGQSMHEAALR